MKLKKNFILREVAGTFLVVAVGDAVKDFNKAINLNSTGAFIFRQLEKETDEKKIVDALISEYGIDEQTATTAATTMPTTAATMPTIDTTLETNIPDPSVDTSMPDATDLLPTDETTGESTGAAGGSAGTGAKMK